MNQILEILQEIRPDVDYQSSTDFIDDNLLDSFDVMALVAELEEKYDIQISLNEVIPENFLNIETIANLVHRCGGEV